MPEGREPFPNRSGRWLHRAYTPAELLVVVVITGFLAAMVAPKLYDILAFSETPIDDANLRELEAAMNGFAVQYRRLPQGLMNLVNETGSASGSYRMLCVHDVLGESADLSADFADRLLPALHVLNAAEARELKRLGVTTVRVYRHTFTDGKEAYDRETEVRAGLAVLMVGGGAVTSGSGIAWKNSRTGSISDDGAGNIAYHPDVIMALDDATGFARMDGAPFIGRIILGLDDESELVTGGCLKTAGTSPREARENEVGNLHYGLLLPRLDATVARMTRSTLELRRYDDAMTASHGVQYLAMKSAPQRLSDVVAVSPQGYVSKTTQFTYGVKIE
jgi:type II secretory pathway pseudopilin PulG